MQKENHAVTLTTWFHSCFIYVELIYISNLGSERASFKRFTPAS